MTTRDNLEWDWTTHDVPTHVEATDKMVLGLTFMQVIMLIVIAAAGYAIYLLPMFQWIPAQVRLGILIPSALFLGLMLVVRIAGRPIPLVMLNLLKYRLSPRYYVGQPSLLLRPSVESDLAFLPGSKSRELTPMGVIKSRLPRLGNRRRRDGSPGTQSIWPDAS